MTFDELQQVIKNRQANILPPNDIPEGENEIDQQANPSLDEFMTTLMGLRNIRLGRLSMVKLPVAASSITANFKPTRILFVAFRVFGKSSSTPVYMQFNGDTGNNYTVRKFISSGSPSDDTSSSSIELAGADTTTDESGTMTIFNDAAKAKQLFYNLNRWGGSAGTAPSDVRGSGGWANIQNQITSIKLKSVDTPTFAAGSHLIVYGTD